MKGLRSSGLFSCHVISCHLQKARQCRRRMLSGDLLFYLFKVTGVFVLNLSSHTV